MFRLPSCCPQYPSFRGRAAHYTLPLGNHHTHDAGNAQSGVSGYAPGRTASLHRRNAHRCQRSSIRLPNKPYTLSSRSSASRVHSYLRIAFHQPSCRILRQPGLGRTTVRHNSYILRQASVFCSCASRSTVLLLRAGFHRYFVGEPVESFFILVRFPLLHQLVVFQESCNLPEEWFVVQPVQLAAKLRGR